MAGAIVAEVLQGVSVVRPIAAIELAAVDFQPFETIQASHVQAESIRVGSRNVERLDAAMAAEQVLRGIRFEPVCAQSALPRQQFKPAGRNDQVLEAAHPAHRTVARLHRCRRIYRGNKAHSPAMAASA